MKTRKKLVIHNLSKCCANCDYYIYLDQEYITVQVGYNSQQWFHKDYNGCMDSQYTPVIRTHRTKQNAE